MTENCESKYKILEHLIFVALSLAEERELRCGGYRTSLLIAVQYSSDQSPSANPNYCC